MKETGREHGGTTSGAKTRLVTAPRVYLRQPRAADSEEIIALALASRRLHASWISPPRDLPAFHRFLAAAQRPNALSMLACAKEGDAIVGVFNLHEIVLGSLRSAYSSYYVGAPHAGRGYMTEGMGLLLRHAFQHLRLHRIEANIQPGNHASIALVERCGFELEGFSPRYLKIAHRWRDHQRWAIREEIWRQRHRRPSRRLT